MKKVMLVFGTRPEAIKMCPLAKELLARRNIHTVVCVTGQHREMLDGVLSAFGVSADYDLSIMKPRQTLFDVTAGILSGMERVLDKEKPNLVLVHGDTTTAFSAALACFYGKIAVGHVEAGLRTYDKYSPYPEEFNRCAISALAACHFAPTAHGAANLLREGRDAASVFVTGNTVIDALATTVRENHAHPILDWASEAEKWVLITAHRRENIGAPMRGMFRAIRRVLSEHGEVRAVYPVHPSPRVREIAYGELGDFEQIRLTEPLDVMDFHNFLARCYLVLSDSGGIQEEAPALGKPVLLMRNTTERPEGIIGGGVRLVGCGEESIYQNFTRLLEDEREYRAMSEAKNPYGDGTASRTIADIIERMRLDFTACAP